MKKRITKKRQIIDNIFSVAVLVAVLALWEWAVASGYLKGNLTPPPSKIWSAFIGLCQSGKISTSLLVSIKRVLIGFFLGTTGGIVVGGVMGISHVFDKAMTLIVSILRPIPVVAWIPVFILLMGIGEKANISVIFVGAFWPSLINTYAGMHEVDPKLLEIAYTYRLGKRKAIFSIIVPSAVASIITGVRLGISSAWMSVVAAEMVGAASGVGYMISYNRELAQPAKMYVYVFLIGFIGVLIDKLLTLVQKICDRKFRGILV